MTGDLMRAAYVLQLRLGGRVGTDRWFSLGLVHRTPWSEATAGGRPLEIEYAPPTRLDALGLLCGLYVLFLDQRRPEDVGVGMHRLIGDPAGEPYLHDLTQVHHRHLVADQFHHPKVVRDEEVREPEALLKVLEQVHDLSLDGYVEGARGFVGNNEFRAHGEHSGHADPPFFTARELMWEAGELAFFEAHLFEQIAYTPVHLGTADLMMQGDRFGENIADTHLGIERRVQILEDHLHLAPELRELVGREAGDVFSVEDDLPGCRFFQPQDGPANGCLAAAGFAHQPHGLVLLEIKTYPVHRGDGLLPLPEGGKEPLSVGKMFFEVYDLEDRLRHKNSYPNVGINLKTDLADLFNAPARFNQNTTSTSPYVPTRSLEDQAHGVCISLESSPSPGCIGCKTCTPQGY